MAQIYSIDSTITDNLLKSLLMFVLIWRKFARIGKNWIANISVSNLKSEGIITANVI